MLKEEIEKVIVGPINIEDLRIGDKVQVIAIGHSCNTRFHRKIGRITKYTINHIEIFIEGNNEPVYFPISSSSWGYIKLSGDWDD